MIKILFLTLLFVVSNLHLSLSQEDQNLITNSIENESFQQIPSDGESLNQIPEEENQQINNDEGYGSEDEEYYGSEGNVDASNAVSNEENMNQVNMVNFE